MASLKPFQLGSPHCSVDHSKEEKIPRHRMGETSSTGSTNWVGEPASSQTLAGLGTPRAWHYRVQTNASS